MRQWGANASVDGLPKTKVSSLSKRPCAAFSSAPLELAGTTEDGFNHSHRTWVSKRALMEYWDALATQSEAAVTCSAKVKCERPGINQLCVN
jgi:hypothetical protein